jgi:hypothetical protein
MFPWQERIGTKASLSPKNCNIRGQQERTTREDEGIIGIGVRLVDGQIL